MSSNSCLAMDQPPADPRERGKPRQRPQRPALGQYDPLIHMLLSTPGRWHVVDLYDHAKFHPGYVSPVMAALHRRGFDVSKRRLDGETYVWARWPFAVPEWVVVSPHDSDREIVMVVDTTGPDWDQPSLFEQ